MDTSNVLHQLLDHSVRSHPNRTAVEEPDFGSISYQDLALLSDQVRDRLIWLGVGCGDRVGIYLHKSIDAVAAIFGILKAGAAYVPVDPAAPVARNTYILRDCAVKAVVLERQFAEPLIGEYARLQVDAPRLFQLLGTGGGVPLRTALESAQEQDPAPTFATLLPSSEELGYILYTSGSTGRPKGVMLSHKNALSFVDWCSEAFEPTERDRFSSHAPLHFDLSILDIYLPIRHGATVILVGEEDGKNPTRLASLISERRITSWYSTPSILSLLAYHGKLEQHSYSALRRVIFAGEVFPVKHLRELKRLLPNPRYFNLYGPTETNVCTFFEIPKQIPEDRVQPFPIGKACTHYQIKVVDEDGSEVVQGQEGELCASGPAVMQGYWNLPERTAKAFLNAPIGKPWYRTGDIVFEDGNGDYIYVGRRDRMVKRRGYRVELGEIENGLYRHPEVREAAVVAVWNEDKGLTIKGFISCRGEKRPSMVELKRFCAENLPGYMIPDVFSFQDTLPKTSTNKIDYQKLIGLG